MVKVRLQQFDREDTSKIITVDLYLDGYIKSNLDIGLDRLKKDFDMVWFVDGGEGNGKSDLMATLAYYVNPAVSRHTLIDRICVNADEFDKALLNANKFEAVVFDEAFGAMAATGTMSKITKILTTRFTEIRSKNLFVFIGSPSFMDISKYFAIWRSKCLLHVYLGKNSKRGFCSFYGEKKKKKLYILGKKNFYNYGCVSPQFVFNFTKQMHKVVNKDAYDVKKVSIQSDTLEVAQLKRRESLVKLQNLKIITHIIRKNPKITAKEVTEILGLNIGSVADYLTQIRKHFREKYPNPLENPLNQVRTPQIY